jgi:hypothetical protein
MEFWELPGEEVLEISRIIEGSTTENIKGTRIMGKRT